MRKNQCSLLLLTLLLMGLALPAAARGKATYEVTVTNITRGQTFTPILFATHSSRIGLLEVGEPASAELEDLAESGATAPFLTLLDGLGNLVGDAKASEGLLAPGDSTSVTIQTSRRARRLSAAAMLIPTNDTFFALDTVSLPLRGTRTFYAPAFDAGTEENDQNCDNIPGPRCEGEGLSAEPAEGDEGYVYISNGFHDLGIEEGGVEDEDGPVILGPAEYDWRNPVARIVVKRLY